MSGKLRDLFLGVCTEALAAQQPDGSMPAGHNGPYRDPETPLRNTAHWSIAFGRAHELSRREYFAQAAIRCLDFILGDAQFRSGYNFVQRCKPGKDSCNGLIGPAWMIEALGEGYRRFQRVECLNLARQIFELHPFENRSGLWHRVEPDGKVLSVDGTLNHQLWFYAMSLWLEASLGENSLRALHSFESRLPQHLGLAPNGRIRHPVWGALRTVKEWVRSGWNPRQARLMLLKEVGYHCFNLYALALVKKYRPNTLTALNAKLQRAIAYLAHPEFSSLLPASIHSFAYNPPGFELPVIAETFGLWPNLAKVIQQTIQLQLNLTYNPTTKSFSEGNPDPLTLTARIYELSRVTDSFFDSQNVQLESPRAGPEVENL